MGIRFSAVVLGIAWLMSLPTWATTVLEKSFADLVQEADTIVVGTVSTVEGKWDADSEIPLTLVTFTDLDILKGDTDSETLTLRFLGGPLPDGTVYQLAGIPQFAVGERNVLFVAGNDHYAVPLVGLWQGVYQVVFDPERDTDTLYTHDMQPLTALPTGGGHILHDEGPDDHQALLSGTPMSLETFTQSIEQEMHND